MDTGIEHYTSIADNYMTDDPYRLRYHNNRFKTFNDLIPEKPSRILDFGCGSAENVVILGQKGHSVVGMDPVARLVEIGTRNLEEAGLPRDSLLVGGVEKMAEFDDASFDIVTALSVLSYLNDEETGEFYRQTKRLLAPGGKAVLSFSNALVDLVTFNRFTVEFWKSNIIPGLTDDEGERQELLEGLVSSLSKPDEPVSRHSENDKVIRKRRNPLIIEEEVTHWGYVLEDIAFTHFHPLPPQFIENSEKFRELKFTCEEKMQKSKWMGYLFASMFVVRLSVQ